ncbi:guanine nucleotide exchange factor MSS4-like [Uloborus diversus]|uniref:guanine nucleotide exchange factor MSS4-like n=1 Tax=Uloborus diversus TaxID=327109 RepID=UPI002408FE17|nr:guanine nucleotide exchange factor MSS4-like [Uloborus diversus]
MAETVPNVTEDPVVLKESNSSESSDSIINEDVSVDGKNVKQIKCQRCPSTILVPGTATLVENEFVLPDPQLKSENKEIPDENSKKYWCVDNMYAFENVGFSKNVDGVKYLICADCEIGPIGWHDSNTKLSYVSLSKVSYC